MMVPILETSRKVQKKINTWAIFWYAEIFNKGGLCISPKKSFLQYRK